MAQTTFLIIHEAISDFMSLPINKIAVYVVLLYLFFTAIYQIIIMPIVFNYFIIPKLESKIGKKLEYRSYYNFFLFGNWSFKSIEIANYIFLRYLFLKIIPNYKWRYKNSALAKVNYDIRTASKFEIVVSVFSMLNLELSIVAAIAFWVLKDSV